jgi:hypothetical protein
MSLRLTCEMRTTVRHFDGVLAESTRCARARPISGQSAARIQEFFPRDMTNEYQQIHLLPEGWGGTDSGSAGHELASATGLQAGRRGTAESLAPDPRPAACATVMSGPSASALVVPAEPAWLVAQPGESPRLARRKPAGSAPCVRLEAVTLRRQLRLLLMCPGEQRVRVNGVIAPPLVALKENDCVRLDADVALHVALFNRPCIGPVNAKLVGKECPVCRVPFAVNVRCCSCACGAAMHCEEDAVTDGLQCAQLRSSSGCIVCQRPVILQPGYNCLPEVQIE